MEYPWFKEYDFCGIPRTLEPYPDRPGHYLLDHAAERYPHLFFAQSSLKIPYPEVKEHSDRLASALAAMGVEKGDRVATLLPTSVQYVLTDAGISKCGGVHVPSSFLEPGEALIRKFRESTPKVLVCLDTHMPLAQSLKEQSTVETVIVTSLDDYSGKAARGPGVQGALHLTDVIEQAKPEPPDIAFDTSRDLESIIFTGGTTGVAKGCMLTHRNVIANSMQNPVIFGPITKAFQGHASVMMCNPFFHSYGHSVMHTMLYCCFSLLLLPDPRDYRTMLKMIEGYHPVLQFGVPTQFTSMLEREGRRAKVVGISGSAPLPPKVQQEFKETSGRYLLEGYGLSEMTAVSHTNVSATISAMGGRKVMRFMYRVLFNQMGIRFLRLMARVLGPKLFAMQFLSVATLIRRLTKSSKKAQKVERIASIGIPLPDTVVKVVDVETGRPLDFEELSGEGRTGEMLLSGPQRMLGYWPEEGKGLDDEGFVHTGDVVRMDGRGYFSIVDRIKDMIIVSGYKVYTREVDDILHEHPATDIAATIGVPDPERPGSERVKVFVQLKEEFRGRVTEDDYIEFLRGKVAKYAVPRSVTFLDEMPLTSVFKVNKAALREMAMKDPL